ncbi:MAG: 1,4-dihydroxy-2-naphthoate polyprenyltransferase [Parachlamydiales bacterium]|nr:1,4-dihydroxy-2-naphthoate polyprenyltransferase [Parachlamydiales bacterium]
MPSLKSANPISNASPSALKAFLLASRPKTWIASVSPVLIGASLTPRLDGTIFLLTLLFSLFIQIGTNFANDYFDFIKGADTAKRQGPKRATQQGWISPQSMWIACLVVFGSAVLFAIPLMMIAGIWSFFLAALCVAFGILYTGGPKPLGYLGLGELFVFPFFGPIAACGTYFLQTGTVSMSVLIASLAPGFLSCAILVANNLRDEENDIAAGKMTLVARFGRTFGAIEYTLCVVFAACVPLWMMNSYPKVLFASSIVLLAPFKTVFSSSDLIPVLPKTARLLILYTLIFCISVW